MLSFVSHSDQVLESVSLSVPHTSLSVIPKIPWSCAAAKYGAWAVNKPWWLYGPKTPLCLCHRNTDTTHTLTETHKWKCVERGLRFKPRSTKCPLASAVSQRLSKAMFFGVCSFLWLDYDHGARIWKDLSLLCVSISLSDHMFCLGSDNIPIYFAF